jgi:hypothetical protein
MSQEEIEKEINARVEFKLQELLTGVKNRVLIKHRQAFDMTRESQHAWKAFEELSLMLKKEIEMATPSNDMDRQRKWKAKEKAVDAIMNSVFTRDIREYHHKARIVAKQVEIAQNY